MIQNNDPRWGPIRKTGPRYRPRRSLGTPLRRTKEFVAFEKHQNTLARRPINKNPHGGAHHRFTAKESRRPSTIKTPNVPGFNFHRTMKLFKAHEGDRLRAKLFKSLPRSAPEFRLHSPNFVDQPLPSFNKWAHVNRTGAKHIVTGIGVGVGIAGVAGFAGYEAVHQINKRRARKRKAAAAAHRAGNRRGNQRHDSRGRFT